jgi:hypothetical protein
MFRTLKDTWIMCIKIAALQQNNRIYDSKWLRNSYSSDVLKLLVMTSLSSLLLFENANLYSNWSCPQHKLLRRFDTEFEC